MMLKKFSVIARATMFLSAGLCIWDKEWPRAQCFLLMLIYLEISKEEL